MSIEDYDIGQLIGQGGFAMVYRARERMTGKEVAIKIIDKHDLLARHVSSASSSSSSSKKKAFTHNHPLITNSIASDEVTEQTNLSFRPVAHRPTTALTTTRGPTTTTAATIHALSSKVMNEIYIHEILHHPYIVEMEQWFEDEQYLYLVLDLCKHGNLYRYLKTKDQLSEQLAVAIVKQLLAALQYLHQKGIIHRDLKLSNVLIHHFQEDGIPVVKICDFGFAVQLTHPDDEHHTLCGTPHYIAPEIATLQSHSYPVDLWSVGVIFYRLVVGQKALTARQDVVGQMKLPQLTFDQLDDEAIRLFSADGLDFLKSLLKLEPDSRPSVRQILQHPLLRRGQTGNDNTAIVRRSLDSTIHHVSSKVPRSVETGQMSRMAASVSWSRSSQSLGVSWMDELSSLRAGSMIRSVSSPSSATSAHNASFDVGMLSHLWTTGAREMIQEHQPPSSSSSSQCMRWLMNICDEANRLNSFCLRTGHQEILCYAANLDRLLYVRNIPLQEELGCTNDGSKSNRSRPIRILFNTANPLLEVTSAAPTMLKDIFHFVSTRPKRRSKRQHDLQYNLSFTEDDLNSTLFATIDELRKGKNIKVQGKKVALGDLLHLDKLPKVLSQWMKRINHLVQGVILRIPRLIVYFPKSSSSSLLRASADMGSKQSDKEEEEEASYNISSRDAVGIQSLGMKCMILPGPSQVLPVFHIQYSDQTVLRYDLQHGTVQIYKPANESGKGLCWNGKLTSLVERGSSCSSVSTVVDDIHYIPDVLRIYILTCQSALSHCMREHEGFGIGNKSHSSSKSSKFPRLIVINNSEKPKI
eukprot:gene2493-2732_t